MVEQFLRSQVLMIHRTNFSRIIPHLVIDPEHVHDVYPDVDSVHGIRKRKVELIIGAGQAEVLAGGEGLGTCHLKK